MCDGTVSVSFQIWKSGVTQRATTMSKGMTLFSQVSIDRLPSVSRRSCMTFLNYCYLPWADSLRSCICLEETCLYHLVLAMNILSSLSASWPSPGANKWTSPLIHWENANCYWNNLTLRRYSRVLWKNYTQKTILLLRHNNLLWHVTKPLW